MKKLIAGILIGIVAIGAISLYGIDDYQKEGEITIKGLNEPVTILRDDKNVPYIMAKNLDDAFYAQGWVVAQDRLFQMEVVRLLADGRLSEVAGAAVLTQDKIIRAVDLRAIAKRNKTHLNQNTLKQLQAYADGINHYIESKQDEFPATLKLNGINIVEKWTVEDLLATTAFSDWITGGTFEPKILRTLLQEKLGKETAALLDAPVKAPAQLDKQNSEKESEESPKTVSLLNSFNPEGKAVGSNTWVVAGKKSRSGKPLLANDPHLDPRILPGVWYPVVIITPEWIIAGGSGNTLPGVSFGRNQYISWGITNSYGDVVDLYEETSDSDNTNYYVEKGKKIPFVERNEIFRIRNPQNGSITEENITIRYTSRGPILNDLGVVNKDDKLVSLRASIAEFNVEGIGNLELNFAKNMTEARNAIGKISAPINFSVIDREGNIAIQSSGFIPKRTQFRNAAIIAKPDENPWEGLITANEMPHIINPDNGYAISANQYLPDEHYPHYFSSYGAHTFRYDRIAQRLEAIDTLDSEAMHQIQHDVYNKLAESIVPIIVDALKETEFKDIAKYLADWNYEDKIDAVAPTIFQSLVLNLFKNIYSDELGEELLTQYLSYPYLWQNSLERSIIKNEGIIDNTTTNQKESLQDVIYAATQAMVKELETRFKTTNRNEWQWGKVHQVVFKGPALPLDGMAFLLGRAAQPMNGSGETVKRAKYSYDKAYNATILQSALMVVDMGDDEKMILNIPGGNSGRQFSKDLTAMLDRYIQEKPDYLYLNEKQIWQHAKHKLVLQPKID